MTKFVVIMTEFPEHLPSGHHFLGLLQFRVSKFTNPADLCCSFELIDLDDLDTF